MLTVCSAQSPIVFVPTAPVSHQPPVTMAALAVRNFYLAEMTMIGSKNVKGVRAEVYRVAAKGGGFYFHTKKESIFYAGDDLNVKIMFETGKECAQFVNDLDNSLRYFPLLRHVHITRPFQQIFNVASPDSVLQRDYVTSEEDSEAYSVAITRYTHITAMTSIDFETELTMIESTLHEDFFGLKCYKCHLMSQSDYPEEKDNPNNALWMSWPTHQRFDGLRTINEHRVPQFAISYVGRSNVMETFEFKERERVEVAIECVDDGVLGIMRHRMKAGVQVDEVAKKIISYVFVEDAEDFRRCLTYKYNETKFMWTKHARGAVVTEQEAHNLRRSARVQANKQALVEKMSNVSVN